jgi:hypothetical protein
MLHSLFKWCLCTSALLLGLNAAQAQVFRLDDSASPQSRVAPKWVLGDHGQLLGQARPDLPAPTSAQAQFGTIEYRLATAAYVGKRAHIYYVIPASIDGLKNASGLQVSWRSSGAFASGSARPGERVRVWSGTVGDALMTQGLDLTMQIDLRALRLPPSGQLGFESYFEIEVL